MKTNGLIDSKELMYSEMVLCVILCIILRDKLIDTNMQADHKATISMVIGAIAGIAAWTIMASYYDDQENDREAMDARMRVFVEAALFTISGSLSFVGLRYAAPVMVNHSKNLLFSFRTEAANSGRLAQALLDNTTPAQETVSSDPRSPALRFDYGV